MRSSRARTIIGAVRYRAESGHPQRVDALLAYLLTWCRHDSLDKAIARGDRLQGNLAVRARRLTRRSNTAALAAELEATIGSALRPPPAYSPADVDLSREAIVAAASALEALIRSLRAEQRTDAKGVALARRLLRDIDSPLYEPARPQELRAAALAALHALRPALGMPPGSPPTKLLNIADHSPIPRRAQLQNG